MKYCTLLRLLRMYAFTLESFCTVLEPEGVWSSVDTTLVHDSNSLQRYKEVLVCTGDARSISATQLIEVWDLLENEVDQSQDDGNTKTVGVHSDNGD